MILTDKSRKDFNNWRFEVKKYRRDNYVSEYNDIVILSLIIDWFDSIGITIYVVPIFGFGVIKFEGFVDGLDISKIETEYLKTRREALENAIEKANLLYNQIIV
jgi:hypothetical protein